ncbi:MAG: DUF805 domain-containing protein [Clostridia bacterium]|nr:DUF805 domain-containing protein [Clostridia bacterium]
MIAYIDMLRHYIDFNGRTRRCEFWIASFTDLIITTLIYYFFGKGLITYLYLIFMFIPRLSLSIRRLHDTGRTWLSILWGLIPAVGEIILFIFYLCPSKYEN